MTVRTRFAPSPTGVLHLGNVRIAIFNWLFARHHGGRFVLRIEDTDIDRNVEGSLDSILDDLRWLGLEWDEGPGRDGPFGPYAQSQRGSGYEAAAMRLVERGHAYPCYCTPEELAGEEEEVRDGESVFRYPGRCRELSPTGRAAMEGRGRSPSIRFTVPEHPVVVEDETRGPIHFEAGHFGDFVLLRQDGRPTYNFAVVVDDVEMRISHVIRGSGHLSNTPKQAMLFDAMEQPRPVFAHLPTVLGPDRRKLSKRHGAAAAGDLRKGGYPPAGIVNYLSLLGWSSPDDREILTVDELVERIGLDRIGASNTVYDPEKLRWVCGQHIARMTLEEVVSAVEPFVDRSRFPLGPGELVTAVSAVRTRLSTFGEINEHLAPFYPEADDAIERVRAAVRDDPEASSVLARLRTKLEAIEDWDEASLSAAVKQVGVEMGVKGARLFHPVRKAVTGDESGPDLGKVLAAIGRSETLARIDVTLNPAEV